MRLGEWRRLGGDESGSSPHRRKSESGNIENTGGPTVNPKPGSPGKQMPTGRRCSSASKRAPTSIPTSADIAEDGISAIGAIEEPNGRP